MLSTVILAFLLAAPSTDDKVLEAWIGPDKNPDCKFISKWTMLDGNRGSVITDTVTNRLTDASVSFSFQGGDRVVLPAAEAKGGRVVPRSLTTMRTSTGKVREDSDSVTGTFSKASRDFIIPANRWCEYDAGPKATPGARLEAKLIEGDANGNALIRCVSEVTGDKVKGYTYSYTVENLTEKPVTFKWAGLEGKVEPKEKYTKSVAATTLSAEESGMLTLDWGEKREFAIRANFWARPK